MTIIYFCTRSSCAVSTFVANKWSWSSNPAGWCPNQSRGLYFRRPI